VNKYYQVKIKLNQESDNYAVSNIEKNVYQIIAKNENLLIKIKNKIKSAIYLDGKVMSIAISSTAIGGGVFWTAFMKYIFPYFIDIAKVFCVIKIAQGFYNERRGGMDSGSGLGSLVTYSKWYLCFLLLPVFVNLVDQVGHKMLIDLQNNPLEP